MADALITEVVKKLGSIIEQKVKEEVKLIRGVKKEIINLRSSFESIQAVLVDADKKQLRIEAVRVWISKLKDVSYDVDDLLTEWRTAIIRVKVDGRIKGFDDETTSDRSVMQKVFFCISNPRFSSNRLITRREVALKIKDITERLDLIAAEKDRYGLDSNPSGNDQQSVEIRPKTTSCVEISEVRGRDRDKSIILSRLLGENQANMELELIFIWGMGGVGKTSLAQLLVHCDEIKKGSFDKMMWVCVTENFDEVRVAKAIVEEASGSSPNCSEYEGALRHVRSSIAEKKFLLVLDDVWTEDESRWKPLLISLKNGAAGSKIVVTTRSDRVAKKVGAIFKLCMGQKKAATLSVPLAPLSNDDCWSVFSQIAFSGRSDQDYEDLKEIGRKISDKCEGLPLAAKTIGGLMLFKGSKQEWQDVLDSEIWGLEVAESLSTPLLLSYYNLPSAIKRCFLYCANFPKDCKIEADDLIKVWMAHDYLSSKGSDELEITGREYLDNLVMRSFFQDLEKDKDSDAVIRFKIHDMVHDFAKYLMKNEYLMVGSNNGKELKMGLTRHLTIIRREEATFPIPPDKSERLHTFCVQSFYDCPPLLIELDQPPPNLFEHLKYLKVLDLSHNNLGEMPGEVDKLLNLRYLNLSHNPLQELPRAVCSLCNLQTLKLVGCLHLMRLPQGMERLIELRHLEIDQTDSLKTLPSGIGKLTSLRTLSKFVAGGVDDPEAAPCKLGDLKDLNQLQGRLKIEGLGYMADIDEVKKAELKNKQHLVDLHLEFHPLAPAEGTTDVMKALQVNTNLRFLQVKSYGGTHFPDWMSSLTSLRTLRLQDCKNCMSLPALGKLPALETLDIEGMHSLIRVNQDFFGIKIDSSDASTRTTDGQIGESSSSSSFTPFPKLKKLKCSHMGSWKEWDMITNIKIMPCLRYLKLAHCDKLETLPQPILQVKLLKKLRIHKCPALRQRYEKGEGRIQISHIPKIRFS